MALCWLSRDSHGDTGKIESRRDGPIAISPEKSEILLDFWSRFRKKSDSTSLLLRGGRTRSLFNGLVLQEDVLVRGRC